MRYFFKILALLFSFISFGQDKNSVKQSFNKWSLEFDLGINKASTPFGDGYFSGSPSRLVTFDGVSHVDIGARYMLTEVFGFKTDFAYDVFKNHSGTSSLAFDSKQYRLGLQSVVNLSKLVKFETFTKRISLLCHSGMHISMFNANTTLDWPASKDKKYGIMFGLTAQFKVSQNLAFTADFTVLKNYRQNLNWNGSPVDPSSNLSGLFYTSSVGFTYYFCKKNEQHADWVTTRPILNKLVSLVDTVDNFECSSTDMRNSTEHSLNTTPKRVLFNQMVDDNEVSVNTKNLFFHKDYVSKLDFNSLGAVFNKSSDEIISEFMGNGY